MSEQKEKVKQTRKTELVCGKWSSNGRGTAGREGKIDMGVVYGRAEEGLFHSHAHGSGDCFTEPLEGCIDDDGGPPWPTLSLRHCHRHFSH